MKLSSSSAANSAARLWWKSAASSKSRTAATTTAPAFPSSSQAAASNAATSTAPPTTSDSKPSKTPSISTTFTPPCSISWASTTRSLHIAIAAAISASPTWREPSSTKSSPEQSAGTSHASMERAHRPSLGWPLCAIKSERMSPAAQLRRFQSLRTADFTESVIREMTRLAVRHNAVNLAQGFPDFPAPIDLKQAAIDAINADYNQYSITWGVKPFRDAIAAKYLRTYSLEVDPESEITVVCGATEGMIASLLATINPDDEVIVFEPFYENYHPDTLLCGARRKLVRLHPPDWNFDPAELRAAFSPRTRAIIINTPNNPTGKVFTREELTYIASLCQEFDAL